MNTEIHPEGILPFLFNANSLVRTIIRDGAPWFVAADICAILGLENVSFAINGNHKTGNLGLDDDEKGIMIHTTNGGPQEVLIINEPGLYRLIFKSRKAEARAFQRFVFHEVLPTIRRTGSFNRSHQTYLHLIEAQIRLGVSPDIAAKMAGKLSPAAAPAPKLTELKQIEREERETQLDLLLDVMEPNQTYTIERLYGLLPQKNPFRKLSEQGRASAIGKLMEHARRSGRIHRIENSRKSLYQLPSIVKFSTES